MPDTTSNRRDWLLQQLGITQFELQRPAVLQGEVAVHLGQDLRLIIIGEKTHYLSVPLVRDIIQAMQLTTDQVTCVSAERIVMLPEDIQVCLWFMGVAVPQSLEKNSAPKLITPPLNELNKPALWQMICENEHYFFTQ